MFRVPAPPTITSGTAVEVTVEISPSRPSGCRRIWGPCCQATSLQLPDGHEQAQIGLLRLRRRPRRTRQAGTAEGATAGLGSIVSLFCRAPDSPGDLETGGAPSAMQFLVTAMAKSWREAAGGRAGAKSPPV